MAQRVEHEWQPVHTPSGIRIYISSDQAPIVDRRQWATKTVTRLLRDKYPDRRFVDDRLAGHVDVGGMELLDIDVEHQDQPVAILWRIKRGTAEEIDMDFIDDQLAKIEQSSRSRSSRPARPRRSSASDSDPPTRRTKAR
eukprot:9841099-Karenia_brevis.AAC.1